MKQKVKCLSLLVAVGMLISTPAMAAPDVSAQIQMLMTEMKAMRADYEKQISSLKEEVRELKESKTVEAPAAKKKEKGIEVEYVGRQEGPFGKGGLVAREHSGFGSVSVGGYADIELENFQNKQSEFDQHRFVLNVGAELGERLKFYSEYEIEHGGPDAAGGGEAKIEQAHIDFLINDAINARAGAILVPFGRYNIYHDSDLQDLTDRPLVNRDIIPTTWTEAGAGFFGSFNPTLGSYEDLEVGYEIYMVNGFNESFSDTGLRGARGSLGGDNNNGKAVVGRLLLSPALGHEIGISGYAGDYGTEDETIKGIGVDFLTTWGAFEFLGEWALFSASEYPTLSPGGGSGDVANLFTGGYVQANYHFWFDFLDDTFLGRAFDNPTFTLVNRFGWAHIDDDTDGGTSLGKDNEERRYTLGINYRPVESWVLKLEYQNNYSRAERLERGNDEGFIASIAMGF